MSKCDFLNCYNFSQDSYNLCASPPKEGKKKLSLAKNSGLPASEHRRLDYKFRQEVMASQQSFPKC